MSEMDKKERRALKRREEKKFARRAVRQSVIAAVIICTIIVIMIPLVPKIIDRHIYNALKKREYAQALECAKWGGDDKVASVSMMIGYLEAEEMLEDGRYDAARSAFTALGNYLDASQRADECLYWKACDMLERRDFENAMRLFLNVSGWYDALDRADYCRYRLAEISYHSGDLNDAFHRFEALSGYSDADDWLKRIAVEITGEEDAEKAFTLVNSYSEEEMQLMSQMNAARESLKQGWIDVGYRHTVARTQDGHALAVGSNEYGQTDVSAWSDIQKICAGAYFTVGLRADGTLVAVGRNDSKEIEVSGWENVVDIATGAFDTYALTADGHVLHTGTMKNAAESWTNITKLCAGSYVAAGMYGKNAMVATSAKCILDADDLVEIDVSTSYGVGLRRSGRVTATFGDVDWFGVVTLSASGTGVLGIDAEGNVLSHFFRKTEHYNFDSLTQRAVAVAAGGGHHAVLLEDGTVKVFGRNGDGQANTESWKLF